MGASSNLLSLPEVAGRPYSYVGLATLRFKERTAVALAAKFTGRHLHTGGKLRVMALWSRFWPREYPALAGCPAGTFGSGAGRSL